MPDAREREQPSEPGEGATQEREAWGGRSDQDAQSDLGADQAERHIGTAGTSLNQPRLNNPHKAAVDKSLPRR